MSWVFNDNLIDSKNKCTLLSDIAKEIVSNFNSPSHIYSETRKRNSSGRRKRIQFKEFPFEFSDAFGFKMG